MLTLPVIILWNESLIQEIKQIFGISLNDEYPALEKKVLFYFVKMQNSTFVLYSVDTDWISD